MQVLTKYARIIEECVRFKAAQEAEEQEEIIKEVREEMIANGSKVPPRPKTTRFDSNVITPGTAFMDKLSKYLMVFLQVLSVYSSNP